MQLLDDLLLEQLNVLVVSVEENGTIDYVGRSVRNILGFEPEELLGYNWTRFSAEKSQSLKQSMLIAKRQLQSNPGINALSFEKKIKTKHGENKWIHWNISRNLDGSFKGIGYDISDRKKAEEKLMLKNLELNEKNNDIQGSLEYARRIQQAIFQDRDGIKNLFPESFILFQPRDIVSGDLYFYWEKNDFAYIVAGDCTGHGVPGALMSVLGHSLIREAILKTETNDPAELLKKIDNELIFALSKNGSETIKDGMDLAIAVINKNNGQLKYAGAFRPLLIVRDDLVIELSAARYPLGFYSDVQKEFTSQGFQLQKGDELFLFSDGYIDQFGGEEGKKLNKKRFRDLLLSTSGMNAEEKESYLEWSHRNWAQHEEQTDDILVMGVKF